jgi:phosphoribosylpyrophosphate synthetase
MKLVAQMLVKAGLTHLITVDLHQKEIQGFFDIPVDNLRASSFLLDYIQQQVKTKIIHLYIENIYFRFLIGAILSL